MERVWLGVLAALLAVLPACGTSRPTVTAVSPNAGATFDYGTPVRFAWKTGSIGSVTLKIYRGPTFHNDQPVRTYSHIADTQFSVPLVDPLPPGDYFWVAVLNLSNGQERNEPRPFAVTVR